MAAVLENLLINIWIPNQAVCHSQQSVAIDCCEFPYLSGNGN